MFQGFQFSWLAWLFTMGWVLLSGFVSFLEGTFTRHSVRGVTLPFVNHGGMWSDLILLAVMNGFVVAHTKLRPLSWVLVSSVSSIITIAMHLQWANWFREAGITGHMFRVGRVEMTNAGYLHFAYMIVQLSLIFLYLFTPMPTKVVVIASLLLTLHLPLGTIQPGWYVTGKLWTWGNMLPSLVLIPLVWFSAFLKIR